MSALRLASRMSTGSVRNEVAVGIFRLSFIAFASIADGPRSAFASPSAAGAGRGAGAVGGGRDIGLRRPCRPRRCPGRSRDRCRGRPPSAWRSGRRAAFAVGCRWVAGRRRDWRGLRLAVRRRRAGGRGRRSSRPAAGRPATTSSGSTRSFVIVPAAGAGTSASTLSVETSTTVSPSATESPYCIAHSRTVPSVTDSPISGMRRRRSLRRRSPSPPRRGRASPRPNRLARLRRGCSGSCRRCRRRPRRRR